MELQHVFKNLRMTLLDLTNVSLIQQSVSSHDFSRASGSTCVGHNSDSYSPFSAFDIQGILPLFLEIPFNCPGQ